MTDILWYIAAAIALVVITYVVDSYLDRKEKKLYQDGNL